MRSGFCEACIAYVAMLLPGCGSSGGTPASTSTQVQLTVFGATPLSVAAQVAGGPWTALTSTSGSATFLVPSATSSYAVAVLCPIVSNQQLEAILEESASDTTTPTVSCLSSTTVPLVVNFDVSAVAGLEASVAVGDTLSAFWSGANSAANIPAVTPGVEDIAVAAYGSPPTASAFGVEIERGVNVTGAPITVPPMPAADKAGSAPISVAGVPVGFTNAISAYYVTAGGTAIGINGNNASSYALLAASVVMPGDYYWIQSQAADASGTHSVGVVHTSSIPQTLSVSVPAALAFDGPTPAAYPTFKTTYDGFGVTGKTSVTAILSWSVAGVSTDIFVSSPFTSSTAQIAVPVLSSVPGFLPPPPATTAVQWALLVSSATQPYLPILTRIPPNNTTAQYAAVSGTFAEP